MSNESINVPKSAFASLDLRDGEIVEGRVRGDSVEVRVVRRREDSTRKMTGDQFVDKWRGGFPAAHLDVKDLRLAALLAKHAKPA